MYVHVLLLCLIPLLCHFFWCIYSFFVVIIVVYFSDVTELPADTSINVLLLCLVPSLCLFLICFYFFVGSNRRGCGWLFVGAGCHATSKCVDLSCELYYTISLW